MNRTTRRLAPATIIVLTVTSVTAVRADDDNSKGQRNAYVVTKLVSNLAAGGGRVIDPVLQNAWGVAFTPAGSPFWIADNVTGCSTLYGGDGTKVGGTAIVSVSLFSAVAAIQ